MSATTASNRSTEERTHQQHLQVRVPLPETPAKRPKDQLGTPQETRDHQDPAHQVETSQTTPRRCTRLPHLVQTPSVPALRSLQDFRGNDFRGNLATLETNKHRGVQWCRTKTRRFPQKNSEGGSPSHHRDGSGFRRKFLHRARFFLHHGEPMETSSHSRTRAHAAPRIALE